MKKPPVRKNINISLTPGDIALGLEGLKIAAKCQSLKS